MIRASVQPDTSRISAAEEAFRRRIERAMMVASHKASREALTEIRAKLPGRLGRALGHFSDLDKGQVFRRGNVSSASGGISIRSKSDRAVGAIMSATEDSTQIRPIKSPWLWIATPELGIKRVNRFRITPALYNKAGYDKTIGPLERVPGRNAGEALLIVKRVSVPTERAGRIRRLPSNGRPRGAREAKDFIVAFVGIRQTSRTRVVDVRAIVKAHAQKVGRYIADEMGSAT